MSNAVPTPEPFTLSTAPDEIEDLRRRLRATRWPDSPEDAGWSLGTDVDYLRELVDYWVEEFDWPAQEASLSRLRHPRLGLGGLDIHLVHVRAATGPAPAFPLLVTPA